MTKDERTAKAEALRASIKPLEEIEEIVANLKQDRVALSGVHMDCAHCVYDSCKGCIHYRCPTISFSKDYVIPLDEEGATEVLSIYNRVLQKRITSGIKRLRELVVTLGSSSEVIEGLEPMSSKEGSNG